MDQIGKYTILEKIGSGGFAVVYKGHDPFIKRPVAIKICHSRDREIRQRFFREAEIAGSLVHRNITTVYDFGVHEQMPYLVEEYLPGEDLAHMIHRGEPAELAHKLDFLLQIASGLEYAHQQGVIHRDIKPGNVRVVDNGRLKIMDFGTAKIAEAESHLTQSGMTLGTVAYLSPERLLGRPVGLNSDIFSYGVLAYELLSFRRPFDGHSIPELIQQVLHAEPKPLLERWPTCPRRLAEVVSRCLRKDPRQRYATCSELVADLEEVAGGTLGVALRPVADTGTYVQAADVQVSGLLERARQLSARGKLDRARLMIEEVLEMDPDHPAAHQLLASWTQAVEVDGARSGRQSDAEDPEQRKARKIAEAVASIEGFLAHGQVSQAADALAFARRLFGRLGEGPGLRRQVVEAARDQLAGVRRQAETAVRDMRDMMILLRQQGRLDLPTARRLARHVLAIAPDDLVVHDLLAKARQDADHGSDRGTGAEARERKHREALQSIEQLLVDGNPAMAAEALKFAVRLFGEFEEVPMLRQRIARALRGEAL